MLGNNKLQGMYVSMLTPFWKVTTLEQARQSWLYQSFTTGSFVALQFFHDSEKVAV